MAKTETAGLQGVTDAERATAMAALTAYLEEVAAARRTDDWDAVDDILTNGLALVLGGESWEMALDIREGWTAFHPTGEYEIPGMRSFGEDDAMYHVGPAALTAEEIVRRIVAMEIEQIPEA